MTEQQSGGTLPVIYLALVDEFGQYVGHDNSSTTTIQVISPTVNETYTPILSGVTSKTASKGMFKFESITFTAEPGRTFSKCGYLYSNLTFLGLSFSTTGIDSSKSSNAAYLALNHKTSTDLEISVSLRTCIAGESFSVTGACVECPADTNYSLDSLSTPGDCKDCQTTKMYCKGGSDIGPKPGYWRSSNQTDNFIACLNSAACLGYVEPNNNNLGE